jgi:hypothetical protein
MYESESSRQIANDRVDGLRRDADARRIGRVTRRPRVTRRRGLWAHLLRSCLLRS